MIQFSPRQLSILIKAWSGSSAYSLTQSQLQEFSNEILECFASWTKIQLKDAAKQQIGCSLLIAISNQSHRADKESLQVIRSLITLLVCYRIALIMEDIDDESICKLTGTSQIDWFSLSTLDISSILEAKLNEKIVMLPQSHSEIRFTHQLETYFQHDNSNTANKEEIQSDQNSTDNYVYKNAEMIELDSRKMGNIRNSCYQICWEHTENSHKELKYLYAAVIFNEDYYTLVDSNKIAQAVIELDYNLCSQFCSDRHWIAQLSGRSISVDQTSDPSDLEGLPALIRSPVFHLGRLDPFYIYISNKNLSLNGPLSRSALINKPLYYLGVVDTYGAILYHRRLGSSHRIQMSEVEKSFELAVDRDSIIPSFAALGNKNTTQIEMNNIELHFLYGLIEGSLATSMNSLRIERSNADYASIRYFQLAGEIWSNLHPSVVNGSFCTLENGELIAVWRYEPNFNSWSGRMIDSFRTMCRTLLFKGSINGTQGLISSMRMLDFPDDSWIEDIRLFYYNEKILGTAALFLPSTKYIDENLSSHANNTMTGMFVTQCRVIIDQLNNTVQFDGFLHLDTKNRGIKQSIPSPFEKNWSMCVSSDAIRLIYSIDPWISFVSSDGITYKLEHNIILPNSIKSLLGHTPRLSCHLAAAPNIVQDRNLGIGFFHVRDKNYGYNQYMFVVDMLTGLPVRWNSTPFLKINHLSHIFQPEVSFQDFKNPGVCYISSINIYKNDLHIMVNMFDSELYTVSVSLDCIKSVLSSDSPSNHDFFSQHP